MYLFAAVVSVLLFAVKDLLNKTAFYSDGMGVKWYETCWRLTYHTLGFVVGSWVIWDKPWVLETHMFYEVTEAEPEVFWLYVCQLGLYMHLFILHFFETRKSDFIEMAIHHVITITLISLSWFHGIHRIGAVIMVLHDLGDPLLHLAKLLKYKGIESDPVFIAFAIVFIVSRIMVYPYHILGSTMTEAPVNPTTLIANGCLLGLFALHCLWSFTIVKAAVETWRNGKVPGDTRE